MSIQAMNWALSKNTGSPSAKVVLLTLANYANQDGAAFPGYKQLAEETEQSEDVIARRLAELAKLGLIFKTHRYSTNSNGGRRTNEYVLLHDERARAHARDLGWEELAHEDEARAAREASEQENDVDADCDELSTEPVENHDLTRDLRVKSEEVNPQIGGRLTRNCAGYTKDDSNLEPKPSTPLPPKGGMGAIASRFEKFKTVWPFDVVDLIEPARKIFLRLEEPEQELAAEWAAAYIATAKAQNRKRMTAVNWLRGKGWQAFHAKPDSAAVSQVFVRVGSPQWFEWEKYHLAAGDVRMPFGKLHAFDMKIGRGRYEKSEWPPAWPRAGEANARDGPSPRA